MEQGDHAIFLGAAFPGVPRTILSHHAQSVPTTASELHEYLSVKIERPDSKPPFTIKALGVMPKSDGWVITTRPERLTQQFPRKQDAVEFGNRLPSKN
jgi:hypothetical protein